MSVEAIAVVLNHSPAKGTDKLILLGIANHAGDGGAWPSIGTLARYANINVRNARAAVHRLEEAGEVRIEARAGGGRSTPEHQRPNRYVILTVCPPECDRTAQHRLRSDEEDGTAGVAASTPVHPRSPATGGVGSDRGCRQRPEPPVGSDRTPRSPATSEPSLEPSMNLETPQPPASGGPVEPCPKHPEPVDGCRGCGTTLRQVAARRARQRRAQVRIDEQALARLERELKLAAAVDPATHAARVAEVRAELTRPAPRQTGRLR